MALCHFGFAHGDPRTPRRGNPPCLLGVNPRRFDHVGDSRLDLKNRTSSPRARNHPYSKMRVAAGALGLDLDPMRGAPGAIGRITPLGNDAFEPHAAAMVEHRGPVVALNVLVQPAGPSRSHGTQCRRQNQVPMATPREIWSANIIAMQRPIAARSEGRKKLPVMSKAYPAMTGPIA